MARISSFLVLSLVLTCGAPARAGAPGEISDAIPAASAERIQQTVDRAIGYLQTESAAWLNTRKCAACHHVPMPLWALSEAERHGYAIDKKYLAATIESLLGSKDKLLASKIFPNPADPPDPRPQGRGLNRGLPFLAVAARSLPSLKEGQKQSLKLIADEIVKNQQPDGSWEFFATLRRPPINESQTTDAAWIIMALEGETGPDAPESQRDALSKAIAWLDGAKLCDIHQDKALKVLLAARSAKPRETMQATIDELLALQRSDGGWSQTVPELKSDAFATGQTLYALSLAGYTAERPEMKRGIDFLVATQKPDGSWPMISRSTPDGSPGSSKLLTPITCAASSWATLGLVRLAPKEKAAWHDGSARIEFVMDEQTLSITPSPVAADDKTAGDGPIRCIVLVPKRAAAGNPWSWRDLHRNYQPPDETELLARGFHVAYVTPGPPRQRDAWRAFLIEKHRLSRKPVFVGMSTPGELRAGTAKVSITPEDGKKPVHDKVYARSLVLDVDGERLAIVSVDLGTYTSEHMVAVCKERFGISHLVLSSSHTHSDPGRSYAAFYEERLIQVVEAAVGNMFPARISAGHRSFPQLGFNRLVVREDGHARESWFGDDHYTSENPERIPFGPVDPEVGVIKVEDTEGRARAIVMNYACHADVVCQNYAISADFPGAATRKVEEAFGKDLNCLFVQGAAGNIESLIISSRRTGPADPFPTDYSTIERVGGLLAYETIKLAKTLSPPARKETTIRYMNDSLKFSGRYDKNAAFDVHISTILINDDIVIATFPGEPFIQLQLDWKKKVEAPHRFLFGYTWHQGTWPSYVPDIKSAALGGYGADQSNPKMIEVGSGEALINKHLENMYRLTGLMREEPGPVGFKPGARWLVTPVPRDK